LLNADVRYASTFGTFWPRSQLSASGRFRTSASEAEVRCRGKWTLT